MTGRLGLSRGRAMLALLALLGALLGVDLAASGVPDPFAAPPPLALWSGEAATGGFCAAPGR